jgi:hypothetical protein
MVKSVFLHSSVIFTRIRYTSRVVHEGGVVVKSVYIACYIQKDTIKLILVWFIR